MVAKKIPVRPFREHDADRNQCETKEKHDRKGDEQQ
jgi:hypothetical protein